MCEGLQAHGWSVPELATRHNPPPTPVHEFSPVNLGGPVLGDTRGQFSGIEANAQAPADPIRAHQPQPFRGRQAPWRTFVLRAWPSFPLMEGNRPRLDLGISYSTDRQAPVEARGNTTREVPGPWDRTLSWYGADAHG